MLRTAAAALLLALAAMPIEAYGQGKGGGKGGGGGGQPPPEPDPDALYTLTRIEPPAGTIQVFPLGLNNSAVVVGGSNVKGYRGNRNGYGPPFLWSAGEGVTLPTLNHDPTADAKAIADNGLIVGVSFGRINPPPADHLVLDPRATWWVPSGSGYEAGDWNETFGPEFFDATSIVLDRAVAVSNDGAFVAFYGQRLNTGVRLAVVAQVDYDGTSPPIVQAWWPFEHGTETVIRGIHRDDDDTVRAYGSSAGESYLWVKDASADAFEGIEIPRHEGYRIRVRSGNAKGELIGYISQSPWTEAVYFNEDFELQFMGRLGSGTRSDAESINDDSFAVGSATIDSKDQIRHAFLWHPDTGMVNLNAITDTRGLELIGSAGGIYTLINNANQIVARANEGNSTVYVLLTPVDQH
jgi:hypothetical protein